MRSAHYNDEFADQSCLILGTAKSRLETTRRTKVEDEDDDEDEYDLVALLAPN